jgi:hypothetical protein
VVTPQGKVVVAPAGTRLDPKEVENFKNLERAKGNEVRELMPGTYVITPESAKQGTPPSPGGTSSQGAKP